MCDRDGSNLSAAANLVIIHIYTVIDRILLCYTANNMFNITRRSNILFLTSLALLIFAFSGEAQAANFEPLTSDELTEALATAESNGEDDSITLAAGTFSSSTPFVYDSDSENFSLTVTGAGIGQTIITNTSGDGNGLEIEAGGGVTISGVTFADSQGAGLYITADDSGDSLDVHIFDNEFTRNEQGLVILNEHLFGEADIESNKFSENVYEGSGAGLYVNSSVTGTVFHVTLYDNIIEDNIATSTSHGGGGYISITTENSILSVLRNEFRNNEADEQGAGIYVITSGEDSDITIGDADDGNIFDNNSAGDSGGGFYAKTIGDDASLTVANNEFTDNTSGAQGGGFHADIDAEGEGLLTIADNVIGQEGSGNTATESGGGAHVYVLRGLVLEDNEFTDNSAADGGGMAIRIDGGGANDQANLIRHNAFTGNAAVNDVGGMDVHMDAAGGLSIDGNIFTENTSGDEGAGARLLFNAAGDRAVVTNNIFYHNTAGEKSGGFDFLGDANTGLDFFHNTVTGNTGSIGGGVTFVLQDADATYDVFNNIFWDNTASGGTAEDVYVYVVGWGGMDFEYNSVGSGAQDFCGWNGTDNCSPSNGFIAGYAQSNLYYDDPEFAGSPFYELTDDSLLLNAGYSALANYPDEDYLGNDRVYGGAPDLGAFELQREPEEESNSSSGGGRAGKKSPEDLYERWLALLRELVAKLLARGDTLPSDVPTSLLSDSVRDLPIGDSGEDVGLLQTLLIDQGYSIPAGTTGYFGLQTQYALDAYQVANGIAPRSGYFGSITRAQMKSAGLPGLWW